MRIFSVSDWPFALKLAVAPAVAILGLVVIAWTSLNSLTEGGERLDTVVSRNMTSSLQLASIKAQVNEINGTLYKLMAQSAAGSVDGAEEKVLKLQDNVNSALNDLKDYRLNFATDEEHQAKIDSLIENVEAYNGALEWVASMLGLDFNSAVSFLEPFDANYTKLNSDLSEMIEAIKAESQSSAEDAQGAAAETIATVGSLTIVLLLIVVGLSALLAIFTRRSVGQIATATASLADGDTSVDVEALARGDELGTVVESLGHFKEALQRVSDLQEQQKLQQEEAERQRKQTLQKIADDFESSVNVLLDRFGQSTVAMQDNANNMVSMSERSSRQTEAVTQSTTQASQNVDTVAAATEELSSSIYEIASQVDRSAQMAMEAREKAQATNQTVASLAEAAERIGDMVSLINDIAEQTNLLALNATIEAARAGDAGKGFAVVASEVKNLANQTGQATEDISTHVDSVRSITQEAVNAINMIGEIIEQNSSVATEISSSVEQQKSATREIAENAQRAAQGTQEVQEHIGEVNTTSVEAGQAANTVSSAARSLSDEFDQLRNQVSAFLSNVRQG